MHVEDVLKLLNEALVLDREAISQLFETRVACNRALADHPTIQVVPMDDAFSPGRLVGLMGIINGLFGQDAKIAMVVDEESHTIMEFVKR